MYPTYLYRDYNPVTKYRQDIPALTTEPSHGMILQARIPVTVPEIALQEIAVVLVPSVTEGSQVQKPQPRSTQMMVLFRESPKIPEHNLGLGIMVENQRCWVRINGT